MTSRQPFAGLVAVVAAYAFAVQTLLAAFALPAVDGAARIETSALCVGSPAEKGAPASQESDCCPLCLMPGCGGLAPGPSADFARPAVFASAAGSGDVRPFRLLSRPPAQPNVARAPPVPA
jgi:hypothetical protein